jgi:hypothetical protein
VAQDPAKPRRRSQALVPKELANIAEALGHLPAVQQLEAAERSGRAEEAAQRLLQLQLEPHELRILLTTPRGQMLADALVKLGIRAR